jgi:hypothetical protein
MRKTWREADFSDFCLSASLRSALLKNFDQKLAQKNVGNKDNVGYLEIAGNIYQPQYGLSVFHENSGAMALNTTHITHSNANLSIFSGKLTYLQYKL